MMKFLSLLLLVGLPSLIISQNRSMVLVEHFTNTPCPICANNNPKVYRVIDRNAEFVHHISIHTDSPYPNCELHNFNPVDNGARQDYYGVGSTPRVYVNGKVSSASQEARFETDLMEAMNTALPLDVSMQEIGNGQIRQVNVAITANAPIEVSNHRILVAVVEREVNYNAPNGETLHRDVLRDFITEPEGDVFTPPLMNETLNLNYNVTIPDGVSLGEAYVMVYIQDLDSGEILGSAVHGESTTGTINLSESVGMRLFPNPAADKLNVQFDESISPDAYEIHDLAGKLLRQTKLKESGSSFEISIHDLSPGSYVLKAFLGEGSASLTFAKE